MGRLINTNDIRVKPQYIQDVMGIAMIRCEDLSRILADASTVEAILKSDYEAHLKADMVDMLDKIRDEIHATAEMHEDGDYYLRDEWIDEIIDKYKAESEDKE